MQGEPAAVSDQPEVSPGPRNVLFVMLGQTPRDELVDEMIRGVPGRIAAHQIGLLDHKTEAEIAALAAGPDAPSIVTTMRDGREATFSRDRIAALAYETIAAIPPRAYDLVVLASTGIFRDLSSACPTVNGQRAMESAVLSFAMHGDKLGLIFPLERQRHQIDIPAHALFDLHLGHARHGHRAEMARAVGEMADCSYIVLYSLGYTEADRAFLADLTGKPVILPRRVVAGSIGLFLSNAGPVEPASDGLRQRVDELTPREREVMSLVCEGLANKEVARRLGISHKTVEIHRSNILRKMEVTSSGALIRMVVEAGLA